MRPFFSIIIPVYNVAPYLRECLDSVLAQTFHDWEAICIDDGSTDGSDAILDEYGAKDIRFRIVHQSNAGVSTSRNRGLLLAKGQWLGFIDSDDIVLPDWIEQVNKIIIKERPDCVRMAATIYDGAQVPKKINLKAAYRIIETKDDVDKWGWSVFTKSGWSCLVFERLSLAEDYFFPEGVRFSEDSLRNLQILPNLRKVCQSEYAGYLYRMRSGSACRQLFLAEERVNFFQNCMRLLPGRKELPLYANFMLNNIVVWAIRHKTDGQEKLLNNLFRKIVTDAGVSYKDIKIHWRLPYLLYVYLGIVSPILFVSRILQTVSRVRHCCHL